MFIDDLKVPAANRIGEEGMGFRYILDGMNAERILIAAECVGDGRWFVERAVKHAKERVVFGRPIGQNQGVAFPIAWAHARIEAADLMRRRAAEIYERGESCAAEANMAKLLAADASWHAANICLDTGHLTLGGSDPLEIATEFVDRVGHVHLKDVNARVAAQLRSGELELVAAVQAGLFQPLGAGDVRVDLTVVALEDAGYTGWYVLEQDTAIIDEIPPPGVGPIDDVRRSIEFLQTVVRERARPEGG